MNILGICSALNNSYLALEKEGKIVTEVIKSDENYHSLYLVKKIKELLEDNSLSMKDLDFITVNCGPGSFTGIRVALTISKIISGELNIPLVPLDTANILLDYFKADIYLSDARRDMYFIGSKDKIELVYKDKFNEIIKNFKDKKIVCDKRLADIVENSINYEEAESDLGQTILKLAKEKYNASKDKEVFNPMLVKANYIQTPPIF